MREPDSPGGGGRCALTPPDPQLKGAWCPGGFNPCSYHAQNRFQNVCLSKRDARRYSQGASINYENRFGKTALLAAAESGQFQNTQTTSQLTPNHLLNDPNHLLNSPKAGAADVIMGMVGFGAMCEAENKAGR